MIRIDLRSKIVSRREALAEIDALVDRAYRTKFLLVDEARHNAASGHLDAPLDLEEVLRNVLMPWSPESQIPASIVPGDEVYIEGEPERIMTVKDVVPGVNELGDVARFENGGFWRVSRLRKVEPQKVDAAQLLRFRYRSVRDRLTFVAGILEGIQDLEPRERKSCLSLIHDVRRLLTDFEETSAWRSRLAAAERTSYCPYCDSSHAGSCQNLPKDEPLEGIDVPIGSK